MHSSARSFAALVDSIYRSIHDSGEWTHLLRALQHALGADACDVSVYDFGTRRGTIALHSGCYEEPFTSGYALTFAALNPWMRHEACYREDGCWLGDDIASSSEVVGCDFYRAWLEPQRLLHRVSGTILRVGERAIYVSALRGGASFRAEGRELLRSLVPHLRHALRIHCQVAHALAGQAMPQPARPGDAARPMTAGIEQAAVTGSAVHRIDAAARMTREARCGAERDGSLPAADDICGCGLLSAAQINLLDSNEERLLRLYGMTAAEARLAILLAGGHTLVAAARLLDVSVTTVRTHLQRIFSKTFTHSQGQLIALLLLGPARLKVQYHPPEDYSEAG